MSKVLGRKVGVSVLEFFTAAQAWAPRRPKPSTTRRRSPTFGFRSPTFSFTLSSLSSSPSLWCAISCKSRRDEVVSTISQAAAKKQAAEALVSEYQRQIVRSRQRSSVDSRVAARGGRTRKKKTCRRGSGDWRSKFKEDASFLAEQEVKMARQKLREEMADQAEATARATASSAIFPAPIRTVWWTISFKRIGQSSMIEGSLSSQIHQGAFSIGPRRWPGRKNRPRGRAILRGLQRFRSAAGVSRIRHSGSSAQKDSQSGDRKPATFGV